VRAQSSLEFMMYTGIFLIAFTAFAIIINTFQTNDLKMLHNNAVMSDYLLIKERMGLANVLKPLTLTLHLPITLGKERYQLVFEKQGEGPYDVVCVVKVGGKELGSFYVVKKVDEVLWSGQSFEVDGQDFAQYVLEIKVEKTEEGEWVVDIKKVSA